MIYPTPSHKKLNFSIFYFSIIIGLFFISCGTPKPVITEGNPAETQIINEEIKRFEDAQVIHLEDTFYNYHIKGILTAYVNGDRVAKDLIKNFLTESEMKVLLVPDEIEFLLQQLEPEKKVPYTRLMADKKIVLEELSSQDSNKKIKNLEKDRMLISTPIFTRNREYALVDVSKGSLNAIYTSINLYKRTDEGYVFDKTLIGYME